MDISNIIKNLHPLEVKVLLKYSDKDELTSEKLIKELDYKEGHANQAFSWLSGKELLKEVEDKKLNPKIIIAKAVQLGMNYQEQKIKEGLNIVFSTLHNKNIKE